LKVYVDGEPDAGKFFGDQGIWFILTKGNKAKSTQTMEENRRYNEQEEDEGEKKSTSGLG
jgi:hypothetical protein